MRVAQRIVLGTRGSELARAQTELAAQALRAAWPKLEIETRIITTRGDEKVNPPNELIDPRAGRKGLFTSEIERALQSREIDVAVHSAKDLPSDSPVDLEINSTLQRAPIEDILIGKGRGNLASLSSTAKIATGSVRRRYQLRWKRPDIQVVDLRGNVPTRLRKLMANDWTAIVLARAGLERLGHDLSRGVLHFEGESFHLHVLPFEEFLPAGGQGVIALQVRTGGETAKLLVNSINHTETLECLRAEREFLRLLQCDCDSPVGVLATINAGVMRMRAQVFVPGSSVPRCAEAIGREPKLLPAKLMEQLDGG